LHRGSNAHRRGRTGTQLEVRVRLGGRRMEQELGAAEPKVESIVRVDERQRKRTRKSIVQDAPRLDNIGMGIELLRAYCVTVCSHRPHRPEATEAGEDEGEREQRGERKEHNARASTWDESGEGERSRESSGGTRGFIHRHHATGRHHTSSAPTGRPRTPGFLLFVSHRVDEAG